MKKILICLFLIILSSTISYAWYETRYDTIKTVWTSYNLKEFTTRYWFTGNENGFQPHGQHSIWHENGHLKEDKYFDQNSGIGSWIKWSEEGKRIEESILVKNKRHGLFIQWHDDGNIKTFGNYKEDRKHGLWTYRQSGGDMNNWFMYIDSVQFYLDDTLVVELEQTNLTTVHKQNSYFNEELGIWIEWGTHNCVDWKENYLWFDIGQKIDNQRDGKWIKLNQYGEIQEINYFKNGELILFE